MSAETREVLRLFQLAHAEYQAALLARLDLLQSQIEQGTKPPNPNIQE